MLLLPQKIEQILSHKELIQTCARKYSGTRDFIYIRDVVNANIKAAESDYNGIINVASGKKTTINELYKIISETLGSNIEPKYLPERKGDIKHSLADVNNMKKIDYKVNLNDFENQLKETINWFKTKL